MADELDELILSVRADTQGFARDVATMRSSLETGLGPGVERAGAAIERGLLSAIERGKFGFDDLRRVALSALAEIASAALRSGIGSLAGGGSGGLGGLLGHLAASLFGLPGRATGGPVGPARPYLVGERGPELFVPTAAGRIEPLGLPAATQVNITVNLAGQPDAPRALERSARHVARAVARAMERG